MDNAQKAIMIGVGLFLTILVISVVLLITNLGIGTTKNASSKISIIGTQLEKQLITQYDQRILMSQDVIDAIDNYNTKLLGNIIVGVGNFKFLNDVSKIQPWKVDSTNPKTLSVIIHPLPYPTFNALTKFTGDDASIYYGGGYWGPRYGCRAN